ncbi:efflux RND transporter permease subunit [Arcobacter sp. FWKO B]|uniref:efflux RND transporter permease subunit n=1 Tax=Arcobacter sp. FWKO B TaxID=2593672 RepID=UPI0018A6384F|nr:efflux RND transporter permease subunit [Arcobacter sp. FWKO B]QOG11746.1 efflux RND transporter permease subunit [Arcobacter sp. FWKO B]
MDIIKASILKPVTVIVGVILIILFGVTALQKLSYQLTPNVVKPQISVTTLWPGATPYEIERDIIEEQEKVLKSTPNLVKYESSSKDNIGTLTLEFTLGTDLKEAVIDVTNKLNEVSSYPQNVEKPVIKTSGADSSPIIWTMLQTIDDKKDISEYRTYFENNVIEYLERIDGVAELFVAGGTKSQMHIILDPVKLASYNITIPSLIQILQNENIDIAAGTTDIGRRTYRVRTTASFTNVEELEERVILNHNGNTIKLKDIATVMIGYDDEKEIVYQVGKKGIVIGFRAVANANVVDVTNRVESVINNINENILKDKGLYINWLYDQRPYILGSIDLVKTNILIGGILAIAVLMLFLRSPLSTSIVGIAIPISIISTFIILYMMDRSLNTISLAGISFAVGMLLDSAIVVLENIDRHKKMGKTLFQSAYDGTNEVWGALIASALTTIAVFLPIIFLQDEAGQLFKDIAIAVTAAVSFSLFVSISVIPTLWALISNKTKKDIISHNKSKLGDFGFVIKDRIMFLVDICIKTNINRAITIGALTLFSIITVSTMFPKMEYLPQGNRNLIMNIMVPPPGLSSSEKKEIGQKLFEIYMPYINKSKDGFPPIEKLFFVSAGELIILGAMSTEEQRAAELIPLFRQGINSFPAIFGISTQAGVFETGLGKGRSIDVDISGNDINTIASTGGMMFMSIQEVLNGAQIRPVPSIELLFPEVKIIPDYTSLKENGFSSLEFGIIVDTLLSGRKIGDFKALNEKKIDLILKADEELIPTPQHLYNAMISTPKGSLVSLDTISKLEQTVGISEIRHLNGKKTITLEVTPPTNITVSEAMETIEYQLIPSLKKQNMIPNEIEIGISGTADKLVSTVAEMKWSFIFAIVISYLLMSALFSNFIYPFIILFTVPLATAGGFIGLKLTNIFIAPQPLDVLTLLGFIILVGIVVNNAILIVHQSLNNIRFQAMEHFEAVKTATRSRLRPIFMSSLTSVFGMLPLVLVPGPGAEFYRGIGSVITGGLALSTVFTIFIVPALLMFFIKMEKVGSKNE